MLRGVRSKTGLGGWRRNIMKIEYDKEWCMRMAQHERVSEALCIADEGKAEGLLGMYPAATRVLAEEVRRLQKQLREWEKLQDPVFLHVNLLRGLPAKLSRDTFLHLAGDEPFNVADRPCTCHPDDNPPKPCAKQYALTKCRAPHEPPNV